jgi:glycyl-tRNA synthetase beta subunit
MHSTDDLDDGYIGSGKALWISIKKHGRETHRLEILEYSKSREELARREEELIDEHILRDPLCMNLQRGGYPNREMTDKLRQFISERVRETVSRPEIREKMRAAKLGKKQSPEWIAARAKALKGCPQSESKREKCRQAAMKQWKRRYEGDESAVGKRAK